MRFPIDVSATMTGESEWNQQFENRIIRLPRHARERYGLPTGSFVHLRTNTGDMMALQVIPAFIEDSAKGNDVGYVSDATMKQLQVVNHGIQEVERVNNITLGCDPEVFITDTQTKHIISATRFFQRTGEVGHDGMLLEFRPRPSIDAGMVTGNIWNLIQRARQVLDRHPEGNRIAMVASSGMQGLTAGFHLHYGLPNAMLGRRAPVRHLANLMVSLFDYYIGVPAVLPEGEMDHQRRTVAYCDYGKPGGYRLDSRTFEFRLPGGSLMRHPVLTNGLMSLGAIVVEDFVSRLRERTDNFLAIRDIQTLTEIRQLYPNLPNPIDIHNMVVTINLQGARNAFPSIMEDVRNMVGYKERSVATEQFFDCILKGINYGPDLFHNWREYYNAEQQRQVGVL